MVGGGGGGGWEMGLGAWLAIRFKITTGYTQVSLPRISCLHTWSDVWAHKYGHLVRVYTRATYLGKLKRGDMRNKCPNIRFLQGPIYTLAKIMRVYAGLVNYVVNASMKCAF